jgi:hypothetical protein
MAASPSMTASICELTLCKLPKHSKQCDAASANLFCIEGSLSRPTHYVGAGVGKYSGRARGSPIKVTSARDVRFGS